MTKLSRILAPIIFHLRCVFLFLFLFLNLVSAACARATGGRGVLQVDAHCEITEFSSARHNELLKKYNPPLQRLRLFVFHRNESGLWIWKVVPQWIRCLGGWSAHVTKESLLAMCSDALPGVPIKDDIELEIDRMSGRLSFKVRRYAYGQLVGLKRFVGKCRLT